MELKFNKEIYPEKAVLKAIRAYRRIAGLKLSRKGNYFLVKGRVKVKSADEELVWREFSNFLLGSVK